MTQPEKNIRRDREKRDLPVKSTPDRLATVKFKVAKEPHISVDTEKCRECVEKPCVTVCPAENYQLSEDKKTVILSWESCLECGSCALVCPLDAVKWCYPTGGFGVGYRLG
jgi:ferredoxin like protein